MDIDNRMQKARHGSIVESDWQNVLCLPVAHCLGSQLGAEAHMTHTVRGIISIQKGNSGWLGGRQNLSATR
jgi:hypothetical protein